MPDPAGRPERAPWRAAFFAALALTLANAAKPLVIDDAVYVALARQIAAHPGDPYGFDLYWYDAPEPAMRFGTLPALLPYWIAGSIALFGEHPFAWKLALFPFALALTGSLAFLLARLAVPLATPVLVTLALGPSLLPGVNLMLDVPAIALGLLGFALFVRASERGSARAALGAGLVLGLAMQTKYSAVLYPGLAVAYAAIHRRPREAIVALLAAAALFVGWEALLVARYGESHFLAGIERLRTFVNLEEVRRAEAQHPGTLFAYWTIAFVSLLGATAPYAALLALVGLGARPSRVSAAAAVAALAFLAVPWLPPFPAGRPDAFFEQLLEFNPELVLFVPLGLAVLACIVCAALRTLRDPERADPRPDRLLVAWLLIELAGFFVVSPYPAARRLGGLAIAATLLGARLVFRRGDDRAARLGVRVASAFGLALAALYCVSELSDAWTRHALVGRIAERLPQLGAKPGDTIWYTGHWEVQYYGEQIGWRPVIAGRSHLRRGDWLVLSTTAHQPRISYPPVFQRVAVVGVRSPSVWSTIPTYYSAPVAIRQQIVPHAFARIYRLTDDADPVPPPP
jgi:4-amino-4-deoxy-L-arabinose transferase-like glycosyltransferase